MHVRVAAETEGALGVREISGNRITVRLRVSDEYPMDTLRRICDLVSGDRFEWDIGARTGAIVLPDSHTPEGFLRDIGEEGY